MQNFFKYIKPALLMVALIGYSSLANSAFAETTNANNIMGNQSYNSVSYNLGGSNENAGKSVLAQVYNLIRFAYIFFYAIAVLLVAQAWLQFKQQKYDVMFASMGAALGLFLTPALIDFIHGLGMATATTSS